MAYCTIQDLVDRYGENRMPVEDKEAEPQIRDDVKIQAGINDATATIDRYWRWLLEKDDLGEPVHEEPTIVLPLCVDIAWFRITDTATADDDSRKRYDEAIKTLQSGEGLRKDELVPPNGELNFFKANLL